MDKFLHIIKRYIPLKLFKALQPVYHFLFGALAAAWHGWPSRKLIVIGVTGTTGKTTSVYLIARLLISAGFRVGFTSTAMFNDGKTEWLNDKKMTMPGRFFAQKIIKKMVKNKCQYAIIETTSQGIGQFRHKFINYDILIFTGLYPEHIEAHGSFENYKQAKAGLFARLKQGKTKYADDKRKVIKAENGFKKIDANRVKKIIIVNADDKQADFFLSFWAEGKYGYTKENETPLRQPADGRASLRDDKTEIVKYGGVKSDKTGVSFKVENKVEINLQLLGEYNAANAMTAVCLAISQGIELAEIKKGLEKVKSIPGRLELIKNEKPVFTVVIDYAFEPEALRKIYETILKLDHNKIIQVLGSAGGGRDAARRPKLGRLAGAKADLVIVTNEDPYDDDPKIIIDQVARGAESAGKILDKNLFKIEDRREAIRKALSWAEENDLVLITGKGCEQAICVAEGVKIPWDDRKVVREEMKQLAPNLNDITCC